MAYTIQVTGKTNMRIYDYLVREGLTVTEWAINCGLDTAEASRVLQGKEIPMRKKIKIAKGSNVDSRAFWPDEQIKEVEQHG